MKFNKLIPELNVSHFQKSLKFYTKVLHFKVEYLRKEDKFAFLSLNGSQLMIQELHETWKTGKLTPPFGRGLNLQIMVKSLTPLLISLEKHNHPLFIGVKTNWYRKDNVLLGDKEFLIQDPDGYLLRFSQDMGKIPVKRKK